MQKKRPLNEQRSKSGRGGEMVAASPYPSGLSQAPVSLRFARVEPLREFSSLMQKKRPLNEQRSKSGRGGEIRTPDLLLPKQPRYQTALHPVFLSRGKRRNIGDFFVNDNSFF